MPRPLATPALSRFFPLCVLLAIMKLSPASRITTTLLQVFNEIPPGVVPEACCSQQVRLRSCFQRDYRAWHHQLDGIPS